MAARARNERGVAPPTPVAALSLGAVLLAGIAFLATAGGTDEPVDAARPVIATPSPTPTAPTPTIAPEPTRERQHAVRRGEVYVEVYNNSGISGLAGSTAKTVSGAGWQVVGSDNWYGTIPASTVYYPERLKQEARLLGRDLGIKRLKPAIAPMRLDRLTVILTADYA
ncbi:LytR C-terminal domain-containing protein [Nocardioides pakistanensis]